jgi:hypothetical protein
MPIVVDFDRFGNPIGIEILSLAYHCGKNSLKSQDWEAHNVNPQIQFIYRESDDVLYVRLENDRSLDQRSVEGSMLCDSKGEPIAIYVPLEM